MLLLFAFGLLVEYFARNPKGLVSVLAHTQPGFALGGTVKAIQCCRELCPQLLPVLQVLNFGPFLQQVSAVVKTLDDRRQIVKTGAETVASIHDRQELPDVLRAP
jgi:hypothetical protein